jgi:hypothetical protein
MVGDQERRLLSLFALHQTWLDRVRRMPLDATIALLAAAVALFGWANWRERRERARPPGEPPSLVPHMLLQMIAVVVALVMLAHLLSWATGAPFKGRLGF